MKHQFDVTLRSFQTIYRKLNRSRLLPRALNSVFIASLLLSNLTGTAQASPNNPNEKPAESKSSQVQRNFLEDVGKFFSRLNDIPQQSTGCTTSGDLVIASGVTCTLSAGSYTFNSVVVQSGGTLRLLSLDNGDTNYTNDLGLTLNADSLTVEANGLITADGLGYAASKGPGVGAAGSWAGPQPGGSGYGGKGGDGNGPAGGNAYGNLYTPADLGSGGRTNGGALGGPGGGAVRLIVTNSLVVNGAISSNGAAGATNQFEAGGGGSGGSLWVTAGALSGSGEIRANGGQGHAVYGYSGGGAGGRIAIDVPLINNTFTGLVKAFGAIGNEIGGAGTIYWTTENRAVMNNNSQAGAETILLAGDYNLDKIDVKGKAILRILGAASNVTLSNTNLTGDGSGRLEVEGIVQAPASFTISGVMLSIEDDLVGPTSITTQTSGGLELKASSPAFPGGIYNFDSVIVKSGSTLRLVSYDNGDTNYTNDLGLTLNVNSLTVDSNGLVFADGMGYAASKGPGVGVAGAWAGPQPGGSGYGGKGGSGNGPAGGNAYGSLYAPADLGSGGRTDGSGIGGAGGGAVRLIVANNLVVNGAISANGTDGTRAQFEAGGGASGGSLWITAGTLSGSGEIRANGGQGRSAYGYSGGGAGGRIAIDVSLSNNTFTGQVKAYGGVGNQIGGAGTIYWTTENRIVANNNSQAGAETILLASDYNLDKIDVKGKATLRVLGAVSNITLTNTNLAGDGTGRLEVAGVVQAPANFTLSGVMLDIENGLIGPNSIITQTNGGLELRASSPAHPGGVYSFDAITVGAGTSLRLVSYDNGDTNYTNDYGVTLNVNNLTVQSGGLVSADGMGYATSKGPGAGTNGNASYGGLGGGSPDGSAYGSFATPANLGSGGTGGAGGGAIKLVVTNVLSVSGAISANGGGAGASGGSIWITADTLSGVGEIRVNSGASGGGGRIAIDVPLGNNAFSGLVKSYGGSGSQIGGAGTIYWTSENRLVVNNDAQAGAKTILLAGNYNLDKIDIKGKAILRILGAASNVTLSNTNLVGDGSGRLEVEGDVQAPANFTLSGVMLSIENGLTGPASITMQTSGGLELKASSPAHPGGVYSFDSITVGSGSTLRLVSYDNGDTNYTNDFGVTLNTDSLMIQSGGLVSADGLGYASAKGPGVGAAGAWAGPQPGGSGYGGKGGDGAGPLGGSTYGNLYTPADLGSGGRNNGGFAGGVGGGAVRLVVSNSLTVNGTISANGANGVPGQFEAGAGGSGGSIWVTAGTLTGSGTIRANGGQGAVAQFGTAGGGGGGRIAIYSDNIAPTVAMTVAGGTGYQKGDAGTIYLGSVDPTQSTVQIAPPTIPVDNIDGAVVSVTLLNINGQPVPNAPVEIALASGPALSINNQAVGLNQYVSIGSTNQNGVAVGKLTATIAGSRTIQGRSGQQLIGQQGTVEFLPGLVSTTGSTIAPVTQQSLADGTTTATVTVTVLDAHDNPIPGADVVLAATGSALIIQPASQTNSLGKTTGQITNTVAETVTVSASVNGVAINDQVQVKFRGADLVVTQSAVAPTNQGSSSDHATAGNSITYTLKVQNSGLMQAGGVTLTDTLPEGFGMTSQNSTFAFSQSGQTLTWSVGDLAAGAETRIELVAAIPQSALGAVTNTLTATVDANTLEENSANNTSQLVTIVEAPLPAVRFASSGATLQAQPGTTSADVQVEVHNEGLGSTGMLEITLPTHLRDWVTVTPASIPFLAPGKSTSFTLSAHPLAEQAYGVYLGWLQVTDGLGGKDNQMVTVRVTPAQRTLVVTVSDQHGIVPNAALRLQNDASYTRVGLDGASSTYHSVSVGTAGADGKITFTNLDEGSYTYQLSAAYHATASGSLNIVAGEGTQTADLALTALPGLYVEPGSVMLVAAAGAQASQLLRVTNTGAAALEDMQVALSGLPDWVQLVLPDALTRLDPQEQAQFQIFANPPAGTASQWLTGNILVSGTGAPQISVSASIDVLAAADARREVRFALVDQDANPITSGAQVLVKRVRPSQMTIDGQSIPYQPQFSQRVGADGTALFQGDEQLEVGEEYTYQAWADNYELSEGSFTVNPQDAPAGTQSQASAGTFMVNLQNAPAGTQNQPQLQTVILPPIGFIYTWNVTEIQGGINLEYHIEVTITYADGSPAPQPSWCTSASGCSWSGGTASWGGGRQILPTSVSPPRKRYSQMHLSQTVILAWQAFQASLWLQNTSALALEHMTVQVKIADLQGVDRTGDFVLQPPTAVAFDSIAPSDERASDWVIIPKGTGISVPTIFQVYAQIDYELDGTAYSYNTLPQSIEVRPAPSLDIHYKIPDAEIACLEFDILATVVNNGAGPAVNLRYNSLQPTTDDPTTSFRLIGATIDGQAQPDPMNLVLGDLAPGASRVVTWRIRASKPVHLIAATADLLHSGGVEALIPAINSVTASMVPGGCLLVAIPDESTNCPDCGAPAQSQGQGGDPVNTRTGGLSYPVDDLSLLTSAGELSFRRTYVSLATDKYLSPLGVGWTHNQDIRLIFDPPFINNYGGRKLVLFKDHSGNMYRFIDMGDGTYSAYPGLSASLVKNETSYTVKDSAQTTYLFDGSGRLQTQTDANGQAFDYSYTAGGKLERVTAAGEDRYLQFTYNAAGSLISVADHTGRSVSFTYDSAGNLASSTDVLGQTWTYEYDSSHNLTRVVDPDGKTKVRNEYSSAGRVSKQFDGNGKLVIELIPQADGSVQIKDALGQTQVHTYNQLGTLTGQQDGAGSTSNKTYDRNFRPTSISDPAGDTTQLSWSADGANLTSITDAAGNQTSISYDALNNPTLVIGPNQNQASYHYDDPNHPSLLTSVTAGGKTTSYTYTAQGLLETTTDPSGLVTKYEYDTHGQRKAVIVNYNTGHGENEAGLYNLTTRYGYDDLGRLTDVTSASGIVTHSEYDAAGKLLKAVQNYDPQRPQNDENLYNIVTTYFYDVRGSQTASKDTYGVINRSYYDAAGRVTTTIRNLVGQTIENPTPPERNSPSTGSGGTAGPGQNLRADNYYDDAGNLIATQDERGVIIRIYHDWANRTVTVVRNLQGAQISDPNPPAYDPAHPDENIISQTISDGNGNVIASVDNSGLVTRTYYDELNRPIRSVQNLTSQIYTIESLPTCDQADANLCTDTYYDANGNMIASKDSLGVITRTYYDALNRPIRSVQNLTSQIYTVESLPTCGQADANLCSDTTYDDAGRVIATQDPLGHITRTYYDAAGRAYAVVRNLTGQDVSVGQPPAREAGNPDENIRTDTEYDASGKVLSTTDPLGHQTKYEYDLLGRLWKTTLNPLAGQGQNYQDPVTKDYYNLVTITSYDALGRALTSTDTLGHVSATEYDNQLGIVLSSTQNVLDGQTDNYQNQYNIKTTFHYDTFGQQIAVTNSQGTVTHNYFDALGRTLTTVHNLSNWSIENPLPPPGQTDSEANLRTDTIYNRNGQIKTAVDASGKSTQFGYDSLGRQTSVTDPLNHTSSSAYDAGGHLVSSTNAKGVVTRYGYDALGRLTDIWENYRAALQADAQTNVHTQYSYDAIGDRLSIRDANGHTTTFTYDALGRLTSETDALEHSWSYAYDKLGNRVSMLDANGQTTVYTYDSLGRQTGIDYPGTSSDVTFTYNLTERRKSMTDGVGTTTWQYDELDRPTSIIDPFNKAVGYGYDALGNRTNLTYPNGQTVNYSYDTVNRVTSIHSSLLSNPLLSISYAYNPNGQVLSVARPNQVNTSYTYDDAGHLTDILHASASTTLSSFHYEYDPVGNRVQAVENVAQPVLPSATPTPTETFTPTSTVTETPTPTVTATSTATETLTSTSTYTVTPTITDTSTVTLTPTPTDTATSTVTATPTITDTSTVTLTSTPADTATSTMTLTPTVTITATSTPTPIASPSGTSSPAEQVAAQIAMVESYVTSGEIDPQMEGPLVNKLQNAAQSLSTGQTNAAINQLNAFINQVNAQRGKKITIAAADDLIAQAQAIIASLIPTPTPTKTATATQLAYQLGNLFLAGFHISNLAQEEVTSTVTPVLSATEGPTSTPTAMPALSATEGVTPGPSPIPGLEQTIIDYTYDPLNRLTDADYSTGLSYAYTYDQVGNRLSQETTASGLQPIISNSTYDDANRLSTVGSIAYSFDANGNLLNDGANTYVYNSANQLSSVNSGQSSVVSYRYNGMGDRLQQTTGGQTTTFTMDLNMGLAQVLDDGTNTYLYGNGRITQTSGTNTQYFLGDALGSVRQMTDATGTITLAQNYDPYGNPIISVGAAHTSYGFDGEATDAATGLVYLRSRFYAPSMGRFLNRDTWSGNANQPLSYNKWAYVYGNPINLSDPTGMSPKDRGYCDSIAGNIDQVRCEQIVRGIDPVKYPYWTMSTIDLWDAMDYTPACPLYMTLPMPTGADKSQNYGYWFHYMLDKAPGLWNGGGTRHVKFSDVAAYAISNELGSSSIRSDIMPMAIQAFVRKGWAQGFYKMIGSRQIVRNAVDDAIFEHCPTLDTTGCLSSLHARNDAASGTFDDSLGIFVNGYQKTDSEGKTVTINRGISQFDMSGGLADAMAEGLATSSWHGAGDGNSPYEWGNPPVDGISPWLRTALAQGRDIGTIFDINRPQVYYKSGGKPGGLFYDSRDGTTIIGGKKYYSIYFVVTKNQLPLCGSSCVIGQ